MFTDAPRASDSEWSFGLGTGLLLVFGLDTVGVV